MKMEKKKRNVALKRQTKEGKRTETGDKETPSASKSLADELRELADSKNEKEREKEFEAIICFLRDCAEDGFYCATLDGISFKILGDGKWREKIIESLTKQGLVVIHNHNDDRLKVVWGAE